MAMRSELLRAWMHWRKLEVPVPAVRSGHTSAKGYAIEVDLDHLHSTIVSLGNALMAGRSWNYPVRTDECLQDLERIRSALATSDMPDEKLSTLRHYLDVTSELLQQISLEHHKLRLL
jgi:hypothetical protein